MEIIPELFISDQRLSSNTRYKYELSGAFYDVYSDGHNDYHMDIRERKSLLQRMKFYENVISRQKNYPIYTKKEGRITSGYEQSELLYQVLGLPEALVYYHDANGNTLAYSCEEILDSISFEEGLYHVRDRFGTIRKDVLKTNHESVISAINDLIENGIYLINLDRIYQENEDESQYYPVFIDEEALPAYLKKEKLNAEKLFMDYADDLLSVNPVTFTHYFRKADHQTLSELCDLAFNQEIGSDDRNQVIFIRALKSYFLSMAKSILNTYYEKNYGKKKLFGYSVMDHDLGFYQIMNDHIYLGTKFSMYAHCRNEIVKSDTGIILQEERPYYWCDSNDRRFILRTYDMVHKYFAMHAELKYMPMLFVKMLGLPYPAFEATRFFDFEHCTGEDYVKKLIFDTDISYENYGFINPLLMNDGRCETVEKENDSLMYYLISLIRKGLYISDPLAALGMAPKNFIVMFDTLDKSFDRFVSGDAELYKACLDLFQFNFNNEFISKFKEMIHRFFLENSNEGRLRAFQKFFFLMNSGLNVQEAYGKAGFSLPYPIGMALFDGALFQLSSEESKIAYDKVIQRSAKSVIYPRITMGKYYSDHVSGYEIQKGLHFLAYYLPVSYPEEPIYVMDSSDKPRIEMLISLFDRYFRRSGSFPYEVCAFGNEIPYNLITGEGTKRNRLEFLGLPFFISEKIDENKDILSQINFVDHVSVFDQEEYLPVIEKEEALHSMMLFQRALDQGVYLSTISGSNTPIYYCEEKLNPLIRMYFDPDFMMIQIKGANKYHGFFTYQDSKLDVQKIEKSRFDKLLSVNSRPGIEYASHLQKALACELEEEIFHKAENRRLTPYLSKDRNGRSFYVSTGLSFYAYSEDGIHYFFDEKDRNALRVAYKAITDKKTAESLCLIVYALGLPYVMIEKTYEVLQHVSLDDFDITSIFDFRAIDIDIADLKSNDSLFFVCRPEYSESYLHTQERTLFARQGIYYFPSFRKITSCSFEDIRYDFEENFNQINEVRAYVSDSVSGEAKKIFEPSPMLFSSMAEKFFREIRTDEKFTDNMIFYAREEIEYFYLKNRKFVSALINSNQFYPDVVIDMNEIEELRLAEIDDVALPLALRLAYMFIVYLQIRLLEEIDKKLLSHSAD